MSFQRRPLKWACPAIMCLYIAAGAVGCRKSRLPKPEQRAGAMEQASPKAVCGNAKVDDGEACDYSVAYEEGCPEGWGVCLVCASDCTHFLTWPVNAACSITKRRRVEGEWRLYWRQDCSYDAKGNVEACVEKSGGGGVDVVRRSFVRTQDPATMTIECDANQDGRSDYLERAHYDGHGVRTLWELDEDADGRLESRVESKPPTRRSSSTLPPRDYHPGGQTKTKELDANQDGKADWRSVRAYDERGNLVFYEWAFADPSVPADERARPQLCDAKGRGGIPGCRTAFDHERLGACEPFEHQKSFDYACLADVYRAAPRRAFQERSVAEGSPQ